MPERLALVLADRPTGRPALVALAGAVEASALAERVDLVLARGPEAIAAAAGAAIGAGQAALVAWSFFSADAAGAAGELALVRGRLGGARVLQVAGGVHASAEPAATLALGFDLVARGEGEETLLALVERLLAGDDRRRGAGLAWLDRGALRDGGRAAPVDLDRHPGFSRRLGKALALEITRGCVWACRFCQTPFQQRARWRHRGLDGARAWARFAVELGHRDLRFVTPSALSYGAQGPEARLDAVEALLRTVREEVGPSRRIFLGSFPSELRPEHVTPGALALLRRWTDGKELLLGAQSGSDRLLAAMARGHGAEDVRRGARLALGAGFDVAVDFIVGLPGEGPEDLEASRKLMSELAAAGARVHAHAFMPLPGTPWKAEPPGRIDPETRRLLDRLASQGRAYGQWRRQEELGAGLAQLRKR